MSGRLSLRVFTICGRRGYKRLSARRGLRTGTRFEILEHRLALTGDTALSNDDPDVTVAATAAIGEIPDGLYRVRMTVEATDALAADGVTVPPGARYANSSLVMRDNRLVVEPF